MVIGGGLAGLAAAVELAEKGYKPVLIERRPYLGGRASSFFHKGLGEEVDIGQHVFMRCCTAYIQFLRKVGAWELVRLQPRLKVQVRALSGQRAWLTGSPLPGVLYLAPALARFPFLTPRERLSVAKAFLAARRTDRELEGNQTFADWLRAHGQGGLIGKFWDFLVLPTLNARAEEASAALGLMVLQEAFLRSHAADLGYARVGLSEIAARAAEFIRAHGGEVLLNKGVVALQVEASRVRGLRLGDGTELSTELAISAVPPAALLHLLPERWRRESFFAQLRHLRWNPIVNLFLRFDRPVLEDEVEVLALWDGTRSWIFNRSCILERNGAQVCISVSGAQELIPLTPEGVLQRLLPELQAALPAARRARIAKFLVIKQPEATLAVAPEMARYRPPPGAETPIANLLLAGDWTATGWPSTMEGAVRSGLAAAAAARASLARGSGL